MKRPATPFAQPASLAALLVAALLAAPATARPCTTMAMLELERRGLPLADIAGTARPDDADIAGTVESANHPLVVHYGTGVDVSRARQALGIFDDAWDQQVTAAGFPAPLPDGNEGGDERFDVYLVPLVPGTGGFTVAEADADRTDGKHASPAFTEIDPSLPDDLLEVYSHHEFQHALQFAIDTLEPVMWYESTAVFWEVRTRPDVDDWQLALPDFQGQPQLPLFADSASIVLVATAPAARYEYGAVLWPLYLDEVLGDGQGTLLRTIWEGTPEPDTVGNDEPDFIDATLAAGVDLPAAVADFAGWRALVGPLSRGDDGPLEAIPGDSRLVAKALNAATLDGTVVTTGEADSPLALGCALREVTAPPDVDFMPVEIQVDATLADQQITLSTLLFDDGADTLARTQTAPAASQHASVSVPANALLQLAVCDVSAADPEDELALRPVKISVLRTDIDFPDAGPDVVDAGVADAGSPPPPPPDGTCNCQSAGDPRNMRGAIAVLGMIGGLVGLFVRGARARRRKRMFDKRP